MRRLAGAVVTLLVAGLVVGLAGCGRDPAVPPIAVGSRSGADATLIAHIYAAALRYYGSPAQVVEVDDPLRALDTGEVRVAPGFTGRILSRLVPDAVARSPSQVYREMVSALPEGIAAGDYTESAEDKPTLVVTDATASAWGGRDLSAAVRNCDELRLGGVTGAVWPSRLGTCRLPKAREFPNRAAAFAALQKGEINAAWSSTAAPFIPTELLTLSDRTALIRAENLVPLYRRNELNERQILALNEVAGVLDTAALAEMCAQVEKGAEPAAVADAFLAEHPLRV